MSLRKPVLIGSGLIALCFVGFLALMVNNMTRMNIEVLILCSEGESGILVPGSLCRSYLRHYRGTEADIQRLQQGAGLDYILDGQHEDRYALAEFFIDRGLSVNAVNQYSERGLTPLHSAVLHNDPERARFLLDHGADRHQASEGYGMTPLELARELHGEGQEDRSELITLLSETDQAGTPIIPPSPSPANGHEPDQF